MGALIALIQKLHLCINQLEQVIDQLYNNFISSLKELDCVAGVEGEGREGKRERDWGEPVRSCLNLGFRETAHLPLP